MKLKVRESTGTIAVVINTPRGPRSISTGTKDMTLARRIVDTAGVASVEMAAKVNALSHQLIHKLVIGGALTVEQAVIEWHDWLHSTAGSDRTVENYSINIKAWVRDTKVGSLKIATLREKHISRWINADDGAHLATRRVRMASIRSLFNFCSIRQYVQGDPSRLVKIKAKMLTHEQKEPRQKECFTEEDMEKLLTYLRQESNGKDKRYRFWLCATLIGRYSGIRLGDICALEWDCFSKPGVMIVWTDKRNRRVEILIGKELYEGISLIPANGRRTCFPAQSVMAAGRLRSNLSVEFMRILANAGVKGKSFHCLRVTLASELNAAGVTMEDIATALGHGSKESTKVYVKEIPV